MADGLDLLEAVLLGVVQGLTEWLPVSSSGHLVLTQELLGIEVPLFFDLLLHLGTLVVILVFYRATVAEVLVALATTPRAHRENRGSWRTTWLDDPGRRMALVVVVGTVPTVIVGVAFEGLIRQAFTSLLAVGLALVATGLMLVATRFVAPPAVPRRVGLREALIIGAFQGLAILPGISRSGSTISAAFYNGVEREEAVRYSFLLSVPAILGATLFIVDRASLAAARADLPAYALGTLVAMVVGYGALWLLVRLVQAGAFHRFAWYCLPVGTAVIAYATLA